MIVYTNYLVVAREDKNIEVFDMDTFLCAHSFSSKSVTFKALIPLEYHVNACESRCDWVRLFGCLH